MHVLDNVNWLGISKIAFVFCLRVFKWTTRSGMHA